MKPRSQKAGTSISSFLMLALITHPPKPMVQLSGICYNMGEGGLNDENRILMILGLLQRVLLGVLYGSSIRAYKIRKPFVV